MHEKSTVQTLCTEANPDYDGSLIRVTKKLKVGLEVASNAVMICLLLNRIMIISGNSGVTITPIVNYIILTLVGVCMIFTKMESEIWKLILGEKSLQAKSLLLLVFKIFLVTFTLSFITTGL